MGEVKIKSGNLYPIQIGEDRFFGNNGGVVHNVDGELVVEMGTQIDSGAFTYVTNESTLLRVHNELDNGSWSVEIKADTNFTLEIGFREDGRRNVSVTDEYQRFTFDNKTFVTSKAFTIYNRTGVAHTVYLRNFMLNLGSTALPYQPYFLNRPAHQFVNGQWVDIPTHHYTNGRWQGELTSQSPLKFWADGEMLDWRVEGKTSGNLLDFNALENAPTGTLGTVTNCPHVLELQLKPSTTYTMASNGTGNETAMPASSYRSVYFADSASPNAVFVNHPVTVTTDLSGVIKVGFFSDRTNAQQYLNGTAHLWLIEGSTALPYEPYGGVGDWDETTQRYKIPVRVEGENLFDGELEQGSFGPAAGQEYPTDTRVRTKKNGVLLDKGTYTVTCIGSTGGMGVYAYTTDSLYVKDDSVTDWTPLPLTFTLSGTRFVRFVFRKTKDAAISPSDISDIRLYEGTYTTSTIPPYEVNLYTDYQLMDGDSIDFATDQTAIPIATGNNILTVDTAVQPKSVFVKFEG